MVYNFINYIILEKTGTQCVHLSCANFWSMQSRMPNVLCSGTKAIWNQLSHKGTE